jgi:uncharacterized protein (TIGR02217 family)
MSWPTPLVHLDFVGQAYQVSGVAHDLSECLEPISTQGPLLVDGQGLSVNNFTAKNSAQLASLVGSLIYNKLSIGRTLTFVVRFSLDTANLYNTSTVYSVPPLLFTPAPSYPAMANEFVVNVKGDTQTIWLHSPTDDDATHAAGAQLQIAFDIPPPSLSANADTFNASVNGGAPLTTTDGQSTLPDLLRLFPCQGGSFASLGFHVQTFAVYDAAEVPVSATASDVTNPPAGALLPRQRKSETPIDNFREIVFPENISYSSSGGPRFKTSIFESNAGYEQRNQDWRFSKAEYDVSHASKNPAQMEELTSFFYAMQGRRFAFRFKDWNDYKHSGQINEGDGVFSDVQIKKYYTFTQPEIGVSYTASRRITKPVWDTVKGVRINGVLKTENTDYTLDYTTGIIAFVNCPPKGSIISVDSMEFHVPVRFDTDHLDPTHDGYNTQTWQHIPLVEVRALKSIDVAPGYTKPAAPVVDSGNLTPADPIFSANFVDGIYSLMGQPCPVTAIFPLMVTGSSTRTDQGEPTSATNFFDETESSFVPSRDIHPGVGLTQQPFTSNSWPGFRPAMPVMGGTARGIATTAGLTYLVEFDFNDPTDAWSMALVATTYVYGDPTTGYGVLAVYDRVTLASTSPYDTDARYQSSISFNPATSAPDTSLGLLPTGRHYAAITLLPGETQVSIDGADAISHTSPLLTMDNVSFDLSAPSGILTQTVIRKIVGYRAKNVLDLPALSTPP